MSRLLQEYILNQKRQRILCMNISHTKVYFTGYKQTKLWVKEVERERATWYLGSSKSWFTKSYLIFFLCQLSKAERIVKVAASSRPELAIQSSHSHTLSSYRNEFQMKWSILDIKCLYLCPKLVQMLIQ